MEAYYGLFAAIFYSFFIWIGNDPFTDYRPILYALWGFAAANFLYFKITSTIEENKRNKEEDLEEKRKTRVQISILKDKIDSLEKNAKRKKVVKKKTTKKKIKKKTTKKR